ncbi:hypothetical protein OJ252_3609 [Cryptosporidium canis]|uniref:TRAF3-interacting protein 1 C-terminal domain-containing protein n=1 Tax=Cryptosporidium canis TaxID=195482 RepID=A0ABQ8P1U3_9CRYT|nr:hypothetical protein OJ252_3609 [Cryptosporidium canis]
MKRKFPHNHQSGHISQITKSNSSNKSRDSYSHTSGNTTPYRSFPRPERKNSTSDHLDVGQVTNNQNNKNTKRPVYNTTRSSGNTYHKPQNGSASKRAVDVKKESEHKHSTKEARGSQTNSHRKETVSSEGKLDDNTKAHEPKKNNFEANKSANLVDEGVSAGINMQLTYSLLGKSEFQSFTQLIFNFLNGNSINEMSSADKSQCILLIDYLILRTKKLSYLIDSCIRDKLVLLKQLDENKQRLESYTKKINDLIYEKIVESEDIQSLWRKCDILSEEINNIKNIQDIQNDIEHERKKCEEFKATALQKKMNYDKATKSILCLCKALSRMISEC